MQKTDQTPLWVFLAYSSIETRKGALILIISCVLFTIYCLPWSVFFPEYPILAELFLLTDWEWFLMMLPFIGWYWLAMRWVDKHDGWSK